MIPGSNLLKIASKIISIQNVSYYVFIDNTENEIGQLVPNYNSPITINGSLQPVARALYEKQGLDLSKSYFTFYTYAANIQTITRNISGDKILFNGKTYTCESANDWFAIDGWTGILVVLNINE